MLDRLTLLLPCKPDRAQRTVRIGQDDVAMQMAGCEVGEVLYAVSHIQVKSVAGVPDAVQKWQAVALSNLRATSPQRQPWLVPKGANTAVRLLATGQSTHGGAVQAQLAWFSAGLDVYHIAVYAPHLAPEHSESILSDLRIQ